LIVREALLDWGDEFDNGYNGMVYGPHREESILDKGTEGGLDPMDITDPASAYLFLSDDAQDEVNGSDKKKMKCLSCGYIFKGEMYDSCPECFSSDTQEVTDEKEHGYW
jgi:hypothetical protein